MGAFGRGAAGVAAIVVTVGALAACSWSFNVGDGKEFEDDRTQTATVQDVRLDGGDGGVSIQRGTGSTVRIHREVWYRDSKPTARGDHMDGNTLVLDTRCGRNCAITYRVTVPAQVNVSGHLDTGPIELSKVGTVAVDTNDGGITVRDAAGNVTAQTDTGPIRLENIAGTVTARTNDGGIKVQKSAKAVSVETDTGPIQLTDVTGAVAARSEDGGIRLERIAGQVTAETDTGPIDGRDLGGARTVARSSDGGIRLRLSTAQDVEASTDTGPITLAVPEFSGGYQVHASTTNGSTSVNIATNPAGALTVTLSSQDGGITVNSA
jgi:hypothetical protein